MEKMVFTTRFKGNYCSNNIAFYGNKGNVKI